MNNPVDQKSRFVELANELMGARMVGDFVRDVWTATPADAKQVLARALVDTVTATVLKADDWGIRGIVAEAVKELAEAHREAVKEALRAEVERVIPLVIANAKQNLVNEVGRMFDAHAVEAIAEKCARRR